MTLENKERQFVITYTKWLAAVAKSNQLRLAAPALLAALDATADSSEANNRWRFEYDLARLEEPGDTVQSAHYRSRPDGERDLRSLFAPVQAEVQRLGAEAHGIAAQLLDMRNEDIGLDTEAGTAPIGTDPALHRLFTELRSKHWGLDFGDSDEERDLFVP